MFSWQVYIAINKKSYEINASEANDTCSITLIFN